jgi:hypothetical protein
MARLGTVVTHSHNKKNFFLTLVCTNYIVQSQWLTGGGGGQHPPPQTPKF